MKKINNVCMVVSFVFSLVSCSTFSPSAAPQNRGLYSDHEFKDDDKLVVMTTPAALRTTVTKVHSNVIKYCSEPMPDTGINSNSSVNANVAASLASIASISQKLEAENKLMREKMYELVTKLEAERESSGKNSDDLEYYRKVLSEMSTSQNVSGNLTVGVAVQQALSVVELGGRNDEVLLAREFLYRVCEASFNDPGSIRAETVLKMQREAMEFLIKRQEAKKPTLQVEILKYSSELYENSLKTYEKQSENCKTSRTQCLANVDATANQQITDALKSSKKIELINGCESNYSTCIGVANKNIEGISGYIAKQSPDDKSSVDDAIKLSGQIEKQCLTSYACCVSASGIKDASAADACSKVCAPPAAGPGNACPVQTGENHKVCNEELKSCKRKALDVMSFSR